jgi:hypothetical protein
LSEESKPQAYLNIVFLQDFDFQKAFIAASELASEHGITFNGEFPFALNTNPPTFAESLSFTVPSNRLNEIYEEFFKKSGLSKSITRIAINPVPLQATEPKPKGGTA